MEVPSSSTLVQFCLKLSVIQVLWCGGHILHYIGSVLPEPVCDTGPVVLPEPVCDTGPVVWRSHPPLHWFSVA